MMMMMTMIHSFDSNPPRIMAEAETHTMPPQGEKTSFNPQVLNVLEALKRASHELRDYPNLRGGGGYSPAIRALLELEAESDTILSSDPSLANLSNHLSTLKSLVQMERSSKGFDLVWFLTRWVSMHSISRVAEWIGWEIQAWIDREVVQELGDCLEELGGDDGVAIRLIVRIERRVLQGFDRDLQDLLLKSKLLAKLEGTLCDPRRSMRLREHAAFAIAALMKFNKDVFVGQIPLRQTLRALTAIASVASLKVLTLMIRSIKSAILDELESDGKIPKIIGFLDCKDLRFRVAAMDCVLEIGYFGRKEAIESTLEAGLIETLVKLQQSILGGDLIYSNQYDDRKGEGKRRKFLESHPFASCVARFSIQLEVGEGLRQSERRAFKREILERVTEASATTAEAATIVAEVLWGSSP